MQTLLNLLVEKRNENEKIIFTLSDFINESDKKNIIQYIVNELSNDHIFFNTILYDLNSTPEDFENRKIINDMIIEIENDRLKYPGWIKRKMDEIKTNNLSYLEVFMILIEENITDFESIKNYVKFDKTIREIIQHELEELNLIKQPKSFLEMEWE